MNPRLIGAATLLIWSGVVLAWVSFPAETRLHADPIRVLVVGSYLAVAPGTAFVIALALRDKLLAAVVAMGFSGALVMLLAQATLYLDIWSPRGVAVVVIGSTCTMALTVLARGMTIQHRRLPHPGSRR
jgi:hypothetical protein